ncbi:beta-phosphoglucomutase [Ereboglobus luteus]|uniref:Beta-phosphoglucomutase n=1 Tax=Ereboglobus luteus TaxID=1796921 RepID=A0A2U8E525_9BACT|nr:beta-phosphoglucomutase [Ereboglobus luteus]AWI09957.1 beta-phosphoglucomutase [Ereboglobus luteus]
MTMIAHDFISEARGMIFDLDGVIVDTAKYHYLAWKRLAEELGFAFSETDNERLKGVSRMRSLDILLKIGGMVFDDDARRRLAEKKNLWYVEYISRMDKSEILPGAGDYLGYLRGRGKRIALGSASKNAPMILERLGIAPLFDAVIDGNKVANAKPDPEVFLTAARALALDPSECVVFEDAGAGVEAAVRAGMRVVGIGDPAVLNSANCVVGGLDALLPKNLHNK